MVLLQELAKLLQEPLQPRYNQRYFAGHPSAAIAGTLKGGEADGPGNQLQAVSQVSAVHLQMRSRQRLGLPDL